MAHVRRICDTPHSCGQQDFQRIFPKLLSSSHTVRVNVHTSDLLNLLNLLQPDPPIQNHPGSLNFSGKDGREGEGGVWEGQPTLIVLGVVCDIAQLVYSCRNDVTGQSGKKSPAGGKITIRKLSPLPSPPLFASILRPWINTIQYTMGDEEEHLLVKRQYPLSRDFHASARSVLQIFVSSSLFTGFKLGECFISSVGQWWRCSHLNHSCLIDHLHQEQNRCRLQIQHFLWNIRLGYLLHPSIPVASFPSVRIADIGTGNA